MSVELGLQILTPGKIVAKGSASAVVLPGSQGYMTVLPGHADMITELGIGELAVRTIDKGSDDEVYFLSGGFAEVKDGSLTVLGDIVEAPNAINAEQAQKDKQEALELLAGSEDGSNVDVKSASNALKQAEYRIKLAK